MSASGDRPVQRVVQPSASHLSRPVRGGLRRALDPELRRVLDRLAVEHDVIVDVPVGAEGSIRLDERGRVVIESASEPVVSDVYAEPWWHLYAGLCDHHALPFDSFLAARSSLHPEQLVHRGLERYEKTCGCVFAWVRSWDHEPTRGELETALAGRR